MEKMKEEGPFDVLKEMMRIHLANRDVGKVSDAYSDRLRMIDRDMDTIFYAFRKLEEWKKGQEAECESLIRLLTTQLDSPTTLDPIRRMHLVDRIQPTLGRIRAGMQNYLPVISNSARSAGTQDIPTARGGGAQLVPYCEHVAPSLPAGADADAATWFSDSELAPFFFGLAVFPGGSPLKKRDLIRWWVGAGAVEAEDAGEERFNRLLESGLVVPINNSGSGAVHACAVPPPIHSIAASCLKKDRTLTSTFLGAVLLDSDDSDEEGGGGSPSSSSSHAVDPTTIQCFNAGTTKLNFDEEEDTEEVSSILGKTTVLQLGTSQIFSNENIKIVGAMNFFKELLAMKQLRYLGLQGVMGLTELPPEIDLLTELRVLDLRACHELEKLPSKISFLKHLAYLDVSECPLLRCVPLAGSFSSLSAVKGLVLGNSISNSKGYFSGAVRWPKLRKLSIYFENKEIVPPGELDRISNITTLSALTVTFGKYRTTTSRDHSHSLHIPPYYVSLEWLPQHLHKLDLRCFPLQEAPPGLNPEKLNNLKKLYIRGGGLSSLKNLFEDGDQRPWQVEILRLRYLNDLVMDWRVLRDGFPRMNYAEIYQCRNIPIGWPGNRWDSKICHALETYYCLSREFRSCFLYFSILPEGSAMNKTDLCYLWVGDGIIPPVGNRLHHSTEECLGSLIDCELVQPICSNVRKRKPHSFTLHPSVHRLAVAMATESKFLTPDRELTGTSCSHACLKKINPTKLLAVSPVGPEGPASLFNLNATSFPPQYRIPYVYNLTALQLGGWSSNGDMNNDAVRIEDPDFLDRCLMYLKNLRYLGLQGTSGIVSIPDSITDLRHLRILNLSSCRDLEVLPDGVANLSEMMVLDVSNCRKLKKMPAELLTKPKSLRVLKGLLITLEPVLKSLVPTGLFKFDHQVCPMLTKLAINIRPSQCWMANASKSLPEIKRIISLRSLTVSWDEDIVGGGCGKRYRHSDAGLSWLPPNLEKLDLRCYPMEEAPAELASRRLKRLKKLYVQGGGPMTTMRALGRKRRVKGVEILRLADMTNLCMDWSELRRVFPNLRRAEIEGCPRIASFAGDANGVWTIEMDQTSIQGDGI